jgi:hypothetical protein
MRRHVSTLLLCIAVFATLGTSAPTQDSREASADVSIPADTVVHVTVRLSAAMVQESDTVRIQFAGFARVVPDDPAIPPFETSSELNVDPCDGMNECNIGFSLEGIQGGAGSARVTASAFGGTSKACSNLHFSDDATLEVLEE